MAAARARKRSPSAAVAASLREYARGLAGGLLISLPIIYTMEMWWAGFLGTPISLLAGLAGTFCLLILYNLFSGLRQDAGIAEILIDSVEELGLGLIGAALLLWLIERIDLTMEPIEIVGKVVVEGMMMAIGVSVGTAQLGGEGDGDDELPGYRQHEPWRHIALAACGAVLVAANVAPTEEIMVLGAELPLGGLLGLVAVSLGIGAVILHYSDFTASVSGNDAGIVGVVQGTTLSYAVALLVSAALLWFYGRFDGEPAAAICAQTIVLAFAAMLGASAGRLLLQPAER
jgi:putative integral membrane protein (TIGR02587 family)